MAIGLHPGPWGCIKGKTKCHHFLVGGFCVNVVCLDEMRGSRESDVIY